MTLYAQIFCTVNDLIADAQAPGVDDARMYQAIREASDYVQKEIGWFIPVTLVRSFNGHDKPSLFVPPLLAIDSIVNDDTALTSENYILKPNDGFWPNGPYCQILVNPESPSLGVWICEENAVQITGRWGKYERSAAIGATVSDTTSQSDSQTTLKVSDGSKVSAGMVLLIGSEQELVTGFGAPTASVTLLNGAIAATDEVLTVDNGALVNVGEIIRVGFEQILIRDKNTHQCAVTRGWNGTSRVAHADDSAVDVYRTVNVERGMNGTTAAAHLNGAAISRYFAPDDIQFLTKEIATLIVNKAKSGYQGRTGNQEMGVVFYHDAFPRQDIERLKTAYFIPKART